MTVYERGALVLVNLNPQRKPEEVGKIRPAIIVSDTDVNEILDLLTVVPLTTNLIDDAEPFRIRINARERLDSNSDAMIEQLRSVAKSRILEPIGQLNHQEMVQVVEGIKTMLGLNEHRPS